MNPPCQAVCQCPAPTAPGIGFSTETFAAPVFAAVATGPNAPPPLGWAFQNPAATEAGESAASQENADFNAWQAAGAAARAWWTPPNEEWVPAPPIEGISMDFSDPFENEFDLPIEPIF